MTIFSPAVLKSRDFFPHLSQVYLRFAKKATLFRHLLAQLPNILAHEESELTKKRRRERKKSEAEYRARLCQKADPLKGLGSVAIYLENGIFYSLNDSYQLLLLDGKLRFFCRTDIS